MDTDRQALNPDHDEHLYLPVTSDNQIEIKSKHQENIHEEILTKQAALEQEQVQEPIEPRKGEYTEVYVWGDDSQGQLGLELFNKKKE